MSTNLISFPFRLGLQGNVVTLPDDSADYYAEEIGLLILTKPGERIQVPEFGVADPTYDRVDQQELSIKAEMFGVPVNIVAVAARQTGDNTQDVVVSFEVNDSVGSAFGTRETPDVEVL